MPGDNANKIGRSEAWSAAPPDHVLFGTSIVMNELRKHAHKICTTNVPILLTGGGGTGKEAIARWIHANSEFSRGQFIKVNCAAIPSMLLESELFGYEKGAFTGANYSKPGRVEFADQGTLFLDEIADLGLDLQSKLLHFLQDGTFYRIGDNFERKIDARLLCATNKDLEEEAAAGRFREDLFYRIHVFRLKLPLLRERREDIPMLAEYFRQRYQRQFDLKADPFAPEMLDYLQSLAWPGNIRELSNVVARYVLIGPEATVYPENTAQKSKPAHDSGADGLPVPLKQKARDAIREMEQKVILETLRANRWNRRKTAQELKISYRALIYKIRDAGLVSKRASTRNLENHQGPI
jgi:two-component system, NtrC family, response regulator AtoC